MPNLYSSERKKIDIGEGCSLIISSRSEGHYTWDVVFFESLEERIKIGSYTTIVNSLEGMCYNEHCAAFVRLDSHTKQIMVDHIFEFASRQMVEGTQAELQEYYKKEFHSEIPVKIKKL